ncbi:kinetoplast-associated protein [Angomonas deanei]|uniref:Kinetoplast DNA-associated protein n=1 Tax=Angomonas deanei TaxID=59799 RepID=S9WZF4_9TRYP|nr:kinetoplast-associated protein [Angomonas deanei]EPY41525.1 kinetoplast-associated protein [Angomonas deanei]EPY41967.1 kinetoplast-associated protein [Angomonas deanei]CAD2213195.1 hypothetical protein, conserved [Angomonas deanei]|eukprot:EPY39978.1 kinetoplast-associated protein [Angomonas deanei]
MFRVAPIRLAIGAYSMFMVEQKNNPKLKGLPVAERGRMTAKLYKSLSPAEKEKLTVRALNYVSKKPAKEKKEKKAKAAKGTRAAGPYALFVKNNISKFEKLPHRDRMKAVAKLWKQQKSR